MKHCLYSRRVINDVMEEVGLIEFLTGREWKEVEELADEYNKKYKDRRIGANYQDRLIGAAGEIAAIKLGAKKIPPETSTGSYGDFWEFLGGICELKSENAKNQYNDHLFPTQIFRSGTYQSPYDIAGATLDSMVIPPRTIKWVVFCWVDLESHVILFDKKIHPKEIPIWPNKLAIRKGRLNRLEVLYNTGLLKEYNEYAYDWIKKNGLHQVESKYELVKSAWRIIGGVAIKFVDGFSQYKR